MDNREAVARIKPATEIHRKVRKIAHSAVNPVAPKNSARSDAERITILQSQVDELATAVAALATYIAVRDDIDLD